MLGRQYLVRQATTLLKFAKSVRDPNVSAALIEKAADFKDRVETIPPSDQSPLAPDIYQPSIWTLEVDGRATLAFEAKKYREANELCHENWLRVELGLHKLNGVPLCGVDSHLRIRLARPVEMVRYRQAAETNNASDDTKLVYLIELDNVSPSDG